MVSNIRFRDRRLKSYEKYHYYCNECGADIHPDMIHKHKCSRFGKLRGVRH